MQPDSDLPLRRCRGVETVRSGKYPSSPIDHRSAAEGPALRLAGLKDHPRVGKLRSDALAVNDGERGPRRRHSRSEEKQQQHILAVASDTQLICNTQVYLLPEINFLMTDKSTLK